MASENVIGLPVTEQIGLSWPVAVDSLSGSGMTTVRVAIIHSYYREL